MTAAQKHRLIVWIISIGLYCADAVVTALVSLATNHTPTIPAEYAAVIITVGGVAESYLHSLEQQYPIPAVPAAATDLVAAPPSAPAQPVTVHVYTAAPQPVAAVAGGVTSAGTAGPPVQAVVAPVAAPPVPPAPVPAATIPKLAPTAA